MDRPIYIVMRIWLISLFLICTATISIGQNAYREPIYLAYVQGDMSRWEAIIRLMEERSDDFSDEERKELISYYYGYISFLLETDQKDKVQDYIIKGEKHLNALLKSAPNDVTALAYKGSFIGFRIGTNKFKALTLGKESISYINRAYKLDSQNVQAILDKGNLLYHMPGMLGGDEKEAVRLYEKAVLRMEKHQNLKQNWLYLNVLTTIARHYEEEKQWQKAVLIYEKILQQEPEFSWVKDTLYPAAKRIAAKNKK
jgi:tetratricopeptide (TPR) repeat protein